MDFFSATEDWNVIFEKDIIEQFQKLFHLLADFHDFWALRTAIDFQSGRILFFLLKTLNLAPKDLDLALRLALHKPNTLELLKIFFQATNNVDFSFQMIEVLIRLGKLDVFKYLFDCSKIEINKFNPFGETILGTACSYENPDFVNFLVENGASLEEPSSGQTPLGIASFRNNLEISKYLISKGAEVNRADQFGKTPIWFTSNIEILNLFIENKANLNFIDNLGQTVLHFACSAGKLDLVKFFVAFGIDINKKDLQGKTGIDIASEKQNFAIVTFLLENGAI